MAVFHPQVIFFLLEGVSDVAVGKILIDTYNIAVVEVQKEGGNSAVLLLGFFQTGSIIQTGECFDQGRVGEIFLNRFVILIIVKRQRFRQTGAFGLILGECIRFGLSCIGCS